MEEVKQVVEVNNESKMELKKFQTSFLLFFIGQLLIVLSNLSYGSFINGIPQLIVLFGIFKYIGFIFYFFALFFARKFNKSYFYSFVAFGIYIILLYVTNICGNSTSPLDKYIGRGLNWSSSIFECIFYVHFFYGAKLFLDQNGYESGTKTVRILLITLVIIFVTMVVFKYLATTRMVRSNRFANRFFLYGSWAMIFVFNLFIFILMIMAFIHVRRFKKVQEGGQNEQI